MRPAPTVAPAPEPVCPYGCGSLARCATIKETRLDAWRALHYRDPEEVERRRQAATAVMMARVATRRAAAERRPSTEDPQVRYWRLREIRDHIKTLNLTMTDTHGQPVELMQALDKAIARRRGHDWLDALEEAPVPLVDLAIVSRLRQGITDGSDPELKAMVEAKTAQERAVGFALAGLRDAARADGVDLDAAPTAPPVDEPAYLLSGAPLPTA